MRRLYVPDPLGSTVGLIAPAASVSDTFSYWPYGEQKTNTGTTPTPFQYVGTAGYYTDSPSKTYVRARHLDTQKARWLTEDPIGLAGGLNLYRYCSGNPINYIDPFGVDTLSKNQKQQVIDAIAMIRKSNFPDAKRMADDLTHMLNDNHIQADPLDDKTYGLTPS